ncbi:MAG: mannonate dehydratase [Jatrophihabitans sp.]
MQIRQAVCQVRDVDETIAAFARQLGVTSINITTPPLPTDDGYWTVEDLVGLKKRCSDLGLVLEVIENTPHHMYDKVMLGLPGRDEQLENYCTTIRNMAAADIPILGFHFMPTSVWRTDMAAPARGGATATAYDHSLISEGNKVQWPADTGELRLSAEQMWSNYQVFLDAVLPVADEVGLKLAQHPDDPPVDSIDGFARIFTSPENFKRAHKLANGSPAWGLDLCLGTVSEMVGGAAAVEEMIGYFGPLGKIRYVHFRDVQGTVPAFQECFIGEGNYDPPTVIRQLLDVGFDGWLQDDHVPNMTDDTRYGHRSRAHAIGYIQGVLAALDR